MNDGLAETVMLRHGSLPVQWRRTGRARRISLRVDVRAGRITVVLPQRASRAAGLALLREHEIWATARLSALPGSVDLADGALVPIDGVPHAVRHRPGGRGGAWFEAGEIHVAGDPAFLPRRVLDLLRAEARRRLLPIMQAKAELAGMTLTRVTCRDTRSRWGSCTRDGGLMLSWRLVMAPPFVQEYVAAHEVAHLRHFDHGARFWALVETLTPHSARATAWLGAHGAALMRVG